MAHTDHLRIGIDAHAVGERATGNERFVANVARELRRICDHELVLFFTSSQAAAAWPRDERTRVRVMRPGHAAVRIPYTLPRMARREGLDVMLVQYTAPLWPGCPVVTVVHDVSFAEHPEWFSPTERAWMRRTIPASMERAARIVTVSDFSKSEIERIYRFPTEKLVVAHDGVDPVFGEPREPVVRTPYFLYVGNLEPRKNLATLLDAYRELRSQHPEVLERLVVAGHAKRGGSARLADGVDYVGHVPDSELAGLMQHATALCYPSLYEGFGLPTVEAMAAGTPALVADIPVMREVAGDAAVLLPATDASAWTDAMTRVATDEPWRVRLVTAGRERASGFTWRATAERVLEALETAARGRA